MKNSNVARIAGALREGGFTNVQTVQSEHLGKPRMKVLADLWHASVQYTLQMFAGEGEEYPAVAPALLIGEGDFPRVDHVYTEDGHAINGGSASAIVKAARKRIFADMGCCRVSGASRPY